MVLLTVFSFSRHNSHIYDDVRASVCVVVPLPASVWVSSAFSVSALAVSAREVASVLSSDKSPDPGVKECEPGTVTIKTFPLGQTMLNTSANALMISQAFVFFVAHLLPWTSVVSTFEWNQ